MKIKPTYQNVWDVNKVILRGNYSSYYLYQKRKDVSNQGILLLPKETGNRVTKIQRVQGKEIMNSRAEK